LFHAIFAENLQKQRINGGFFGFFRASLMRASLSVRGLGAVEEGCSFHFTGRSLFRLFGPFGFRLRGFDFAEVFQPVGDGEGAEEAEGGQAGKARARAARAARTRAPRAPADARGRRGARGKLGACGQRATL
jgi:hypothetical protein